VGLEKEKGETEMPRGIKKPKMPKKVEVPLLPHQRVPDRTFDERDWADKWEEPKEFKGIVRFMGNPVSDLEKYIDAWFRRNPRWCRRDMCILSILCQVDINAPAAQWMSVADLERRLVGVFGRASISESVNRMHQDTHFMSKTDINVNGARRYCPLNWARAVSGFYNTYYRDGVCQYPTPVPVEEDGYVSNATW